MLFKAIATVATMSLLVDAQAVHGQGAKGTTMGPAAFLWPADRPWSSSHDNVAPCGSDAPIGNRTNFPLGSSGTVSFSIADESYDVILRIAYGNNPTSQSDFTQFQSTDPVYEEGHQCRSVPTPPSSVVAGSNGTIQLEYRGNDSGKDETFYACADITFVEAALFKANVHCINVTASEFTPAGATPSSTGTAPSATAKADEPAPTSVVVVERPSNSGLSAAEKAGIAVASIVGAALIASVAFFLIRRRKSAPKDAETAPGMTKVTSNHS